jgi:anti-sigma regulatory factor (Ser/Thr protein kinase)
VAESLKGRPLPARQRLFVSHASEIPLAQRAARDLAAALGFDEICCEEVALAASELASNLVQHAGGGSMEVIPVTEGLRLGIRIQTSDNGPGIPDVEKAMTDGFSTCGGLGYGLGSVNRFMDSLHIASPRASQGGTNIVCTRWLRAEEPGLSPCPLAIGVATRAHPAMTANGDAFVVKRWSTQALVAVIDGVGHGELARRAAQTARHYVETHYDAPLADLFVGTGRACSSTRGVVMAVARFDWSRLRFAFASIGNIETRLAGKGQGRNFIVRRGIVGVNAPSAVVTEHPWEQDGILVLHSDGIGSHWQWNDFPELISAPPEAAARRLVSALAKDDDDATVVVVKGRPASVGRDGA